MTDFSCVYGAKFLCLNELTWACNRLLGINYWGIGMEIVLHHTSSITDTCHWILKGWVKLRSAQYPNHMFLVPLFCHGNDWIKFYGLQSSHLNNFLITLDKRSKCHRVFNEQYTDRKVLLLSFFQVINDLLDPTGQNLRIREDAQVIKLYSQIFSSYLSTFPLLPWRRRFSLLFYYSIR